MKGCGESTSYSELDQKKYIKKDSETDEEYLMRLPEVKEAVEKNGYVIIREPEQVGDNGGIHFAVVPRQGESTEPDKHFVIYYGTNAIYEIDDDGNSVLVYGSELDYRIFGMEEIQKIPIVKQILENDNGILSFQNDGIFTTVNLYMKNYDVPGMCYVMKIPDQEDRLYWYVNYSVLDKDIIGVWEEFNFLSDEELFLSGAYGENDFKQTLGLGGKPVDINDYYKGRAVDDKTYLRVSGILQSESFDSNEITHVEHDGQIKIDGYVYNIFRCYKTQM